MLFLCRFDFFFFSFCLNSKYFQPDFLTFNVNIKHHPLDIVAGMNVLFMHRVVGYKTPIDNVGMDVIRSKNKIKNKNA